MKTILFSLICLLFGGSALFALSSDLFPSAPGKESVTLRKFDDVPKPVRGTIRRPSLQVLSGATLTLYHHNDNTALAFRTSDVNGVFDFGNFLPGSYDITASCSGYVDTLVTCTMTTLPIDITIILQETP